MAAHPLDSLGFEPVLSPLQGNPRSLTELGFEPATHTIRRQAVGTTEPVSGRTVVQPSDSPAINQVLATDAMGWYTAGLLAAIRHIPGAQLAATRDAKKPGRLAAKIFSEGQPAETVSDYGAAQITVDSPPARDAVVSAVSEQFRVLRRQDRFALGDPQYHYRSDCLQLQMPNGASEELQIIPKEVFEANQQEHRDYTRVRDAELTGGGDAEARTEARARNDEAMRRFNSRNGVAARVIKGSVVKGARVRLADGSVAKVVYVDPNMRIARVRTEDGRNVTVRHKDLRAATALDTQPASSFNRD